MQWSHKLCSVLLAGAQAPVDFLVLSGMFTELMKTSPNPQGAMLRLQASAQTK